MSALQAEWIKARTLRSTWWDIALTMVLSIGLSALICLGLAVAGDSGEDESVQADALDITLAGYNLGTIVVMVLAIMLVTGEYTNAVVRTTFTAEPRRVRVFVARPSSWLPSPQSPDSSSRLGPSSLVGPSWRPAD